MKLDNLFSETYLIFSNFSFEIKNFILISQPQTLKKLLHLPSVPPTDLQISKTDAAGTVFLMFFEK